MTALHAALDRVYKLGVSLPDAPLARFRAETAGLPQTTETERLVVQRIGQDIFRAALMDYWGARCPITGITDPALLRASHIVPWAECDDAQRLDVHNGLLLSVLWDAAFDTGLVSFADDGTALASPGFASPRGHRSTSSERHDCSTCETPTAPTWPPTAPDTAFVIERAARYSDMTSKETMQDQEAERVRNACYRNCYRTQ